MDPLLIPFKKPLQHVSTLCRQLMFDLVFISENIILLGIGKQANVGPVHDLYTKVDTPSLHTYYAHLYTNISHYSSEFRNQRIKGQQSRDCHNPNGILYLGSNS